MTRINYQEIAKDCRLKCLDLIYKAQTSHIGSVFSCVDIMTVLLHDFDWDKDKFILSAGWKAAPLYYFLWKAGRITTEEIDSYCQEGSKFIGLAEPIIPEIPFAGGSMGMGLPAAVGFALSKKLKGDKGKVYVLMSDAEMQIGTTWESALIAAHHKLDNLVVIVDNNGLQAMGSVYQILKIETLQEKWDSFGWEWNIVDGHDFNYMDKAFGNFFRSKPIIHIANTTKGKGVSFMENNNLYHYKQLSDKEYKEARKELL